MFNFTRSFSVLFSCIILIAANSASAEKRDPQFYAGFSVGQASHETGVSGTTGTADLDEEDTGFKGYAGVKINQYFALEAHYADLGESSLSGNNGDTFVLDGTTFQFTATADIAVEAQSYGLAAVLFIPVTDKFSPFVKAGFQVWDLEADVTSSAGNARLSDDGTDPFFGVGFEATVAEGFKLRAEYELYDFDGDDVEFLSAGLTIAF